MNELPSNPDIRRPGVSVLIARFLAFGDVLLTLPLAKALATSPTVGHVDVVTLRQYADLPTRSLHVRRVFAFDPDRGSGADVLDSTEYDVLLDLHTRAAPLHPAIEDLLERIGARERISYANPWEKPADGKLPTRRWDEHSVEYYARSASSLIEGPANTHVIDIAEPDLAEAAGRLPASCVSMNARGEPIVESPADAVNFLYSCLVDSLVMEDFVCARSARQLRSLLERYQPESRAA